MPNWYRELDAQQLDRFTLLVEQAQDVQRQVGHGDHHPDAAFIQPTGGNRPEHLQVLLDPVTRAAHICDPARCGRSFDGPVPQLAGLAHPHGDGDETCHHAARHQEEDERRVDAPQPRRYQQQRHLTAKTEDLRDPVLGAALFRRGHVDQQRVVGVDADVEQQ